MSCSNPIRRGAFTVAFGFALTLLLSHPAFAQALQPVINASNIARDTAVGVCLGILTVAWAVAGYKMTFQGAGFAQVSSLIVGGAISGAAAAIAALFVN